MGQDPAVEPAAGRRAKAGEPFFRHYRRRERRAGGEWGVLVG